jgi:chemotaxis signal transduction protein
MYDIFSLQEGKRMNELLLFHAGNRQFGVDLPLVRSIQGAKSLCEEPADGEHEPSDAEQKCNFCTPPPTWNHSYVRMPDAESLIPIYDLSAILGGSLPSESSENRKVMFVVVRDHPIALKVDRVERVISVEKDRIESLSPVFAGNALTWFPRVLKQDDNLILLLNPGGILGIEEEYYEDAGDPKEDDLFQPQEMPDEVANYSRVSDAVSDIRGVENLADTEESEQDLPQTEPPGEASFSVADIQADEFQPEDMISAEIQEYPDAEILSLSEALQTGETVYPEIPEKPAHAVGFDLAEKKLPDPKTLENLLTHIVKQEIVSDMILRIFTPHLEEAVEQEIGIVKKIWLNKLKKVRND